MRQQPDVETVCICLKYDLVSSKHSDVVNMTKCLKKICIDAVSEDIFWSKYPILYVSYSIFAAMESTCFGAHYPSISPNKKITLH